VSSWSRLSTVFLQYWEERCLVTIADTELEIAGKKKPTAGNLAALELTGRQLKAIRRELQRRANV
jgi:hypothetical protein